MSFSPSHLSPYHPSITGDAAPQALINIETDLSLKFILDTPLDALMAVEVSSKVVTDIFAFLIECFLCAQRCLGGISVLPILSLHFISLSSYSYFPFCYFAGILVGILHIWGLRGLVRPSLARYGTHVPRFTSVW